MKTRPIVTWLSASLITLAVLTIASENSAWGAVDPNLVDISFYRPPLWKPLPQALYGRPRSVILFIGDGMGFGQVTTARIRALGRDGRLAFERLPVTGIVVTHSANNLVPDSAACATALACGIKTDNGMIGQTPTARYQSILEAAQARGMRTGLVATKNITDATPASFASHVSSRKMEPAIARQLLAARVNVLFGGGRRYFAPRSRTANPADPNNLLSVIEANGYLYLQRADQLNTDQADYVLGLFAYEAMKTLPPEPPLAQMTEKAIQLLDARKKGLRGTMQGFFLMVEGSQIDTANHDWDPNRMTRQLLLFDMAVQEGIEFALRDRHTLVLVTADHETGGLEIIARKAKTKAKDDKATTTDTDEDEDYQGPNALVPNLKWTDKWHTGLPVPLYAFGPGAQEFTGVMDNTQIPHKIARLLGITDFPRQK